MTIAKKITSSPPQQSEDGTRFILPLYESSGTRGRLCPANPLPLQSVAFFCLLENDLFPLDWQDSVIHEFKTVKTLSQRPWL